MMYAVFSHLLQPSLAASWGEKSREKSGKFPDLVGERARVISGAKQTEKSKFWYFVEGHGFGCLRQ